MNDPELFELVKTLRQFIKTMLTQFMLFLELTENTIIMNVAFHMVDILLRRQLLQNHWNINLAMLKSKSFYYGEKHF